MEVRNSRISVKHAPLGGTPASQCYRQFRLDEREAVFRMKGVRLPDSRIATKVLSKWRVHDSVFPGDELTQRWEKVEKPADL